MSSYTIDKEITDFLEGVVGVIEANSFERYTLWDRNRRSEKPLTWEQEYSGLMETVGRLADRPVCISLIKARVSGHLLLFIYPTSQVVDHLLIDAWLAAAIPVTGKRFNGYVNRVNAMNFHNVFPRTRGDATR